MVVSALSCDLSAADGGCGVVVAAAVVVVAVAAVVVVLSSFLSARRDSVSTSCSEMLS